MSSPGRLGGRIVGDPSAVVSGMTHDSRLVAPGMLFACVRGHDHDGHAYRRGGGRRGRGMPARRPRACRSTVPQLIVADTRQAMGPVAAAVYGRPSDALTMVGITGTNGKTTTTHLLAAILRAAGQPTGMIGTLSGPHTTPEAPELQARLARFRDDGDVAVVMEVSSHALSLHRVDGTRFAVAVFTNLGTDHLDLHGSVEQYFRAKARLFAPDLAGRRSDQHRRSARSPALRRRPDRDGAVLDRRRDGPRRHGGPTHLHVARAAHRGRPRWPVQRDELARRGDHRGDARHRARRHRRGAGRRSCRAGTLRARRRRPPESVPTVIVDYAHTPDRLAEILGAARQITDGVRPRRVRVRRRSGCRASGLRWAR